MRFLSSALIVAALAACGGAPASGTPTPAGSPAASPTTAATATTAATPTAASTAGATATPGGTPAGVSDACSLLTADEVLAATGAPVVVNESLSDQNNCYFVGVDGAPVATVIHLPEGGLAFQSWAMAADSVPVPGLGDDAVYNPQTGVIVLLGPATLSVALRPGVAQDDAITQASQLLRLALARL